MPTQDQPRTEGLQHYRPRKCFSITELVNASRCMRRFFYGVGCGLGPSLGDHVALKYGESMHAAFPWINARRDSADEKGNKIPYLTKAIMEFERLWKGSTEDEKHNSLHAKLSLIHYDSTHRPGLSLFSIKDPPEQNPLLFSDRVSPWEVQWGLDIGLDVPLVGRMDGICKHRDTGELFVLEYKTSSEMSARLITGFEMNVQCIGYTTAARTLTGEPYKGVMLDLIGKKKAEETNTTPIRVQDHQIDYFIRWARKTILEVQAAEKLGLFDPEYTGCSPYSMFGMPGYMCEFKNLCSVPDWTAMKDFYRVKEERYRFESGDVKPIPTISLPVLEVK